MYNIVFIIKRHATNIRGRAPALGDCAIKAAVTGVGMVCARVACLVIALRGLEIFQVESDAWWWMRQWVNVRP